MITQEVLKEVIDKLDDDTIVVIHLTEASDEDECTECQ